MRAAWPGQRGIVARKNAVFVSAHKSAGGIVQKVFAEGVLHRLLQIIDIQIDEKISQRAPRYGIDDAFALCDDGLAILFHAASAHIEQHGLSVAALQIG